MAGYRRAYTIKEDNLILLWIVKAKAYYNIKGKAFWEDLSKFGIFEERTAFSLENRFKKKILQDILNPKYTLPKEDKHKIIIAWAQLSDCGSYPNEDKECDLNSDTEEAGPST